LVIAAKTVLFDELTPVLVKVNGFDGWIIFLILISLLCLLKTQHMGSY
jgi:hypothetical protein